MAWFLVLNNGVKQSSSKATAYSTHLEGEEKTEPIPVTPAYRTESWGSCLEI